MQKWLLPAIIFIAFLLRVVAIDKYPVGLNPDEASFGYDAYSLLQTGRDQWGHLWPLSLQSFGDYKLPLYSYLAIPTVAIFGLNEFSTRLPNAIFGVLAVIAIYLMVSELFKNKLETGNWKLATATSLMLAISPWHIMLSRGAFEANLATFFLPFGVWLFLKGLKKPQIMIWSAFIFGLNLFSYHSARLVTPFLILILIYLNRKDLVGNYTLLHRSVVRYKWAILVFITFALVAGWTLLTGGASRGSDVAIFNPTDHGQAIFERRNQGGQLGLPDQVSRAFSNKVSFTIDEFIKNYSTYFSLQFLFTEGPKERTYGMIPGIGVLYLIEILFISTSIWLITKNREWGKFKFIIIWLFLAPIPAALAKGGGFAANRAAIMIPALIILTSYGLLYWWDNIKKARVLIILAFTFSSILFLENYLYHAPSDSAQSMMYGRRELVEYLKHVEPQYDKIFVSRSLSEPHIYFAFFNKWTPQDYQKQTPDWMRYKVEGRSFLDQLGEYSLGKYTFTSIHYGDDSKLNNVLLVGYPNEFPKNIRALKTINFPNNKPGILIVDPGSASYAIN